MITKTLDAGGSGPNNFTTFAGFTNYLYGLTLTDDITLNVKEGQVFNHTGTGIGNTIGHISTVWGGYTITIQTVPSGVNNPATINFAPSDNNSTNVFYKIEKNQTVINFPHNLDLSDIISSYNIKNNKKETKYNLYGVVQQYGNLNRGHYTACTKNHLNNKWYKYDDSNVCNIPDEHINSELVNNAAYILFYSKV